MSVSNYAKALFEIALEKEKVDTINLNFDEFHHIVSSNLSWMNHMDSPMFKTADKEKMIDMLSFDPSFLSFLKVLAKKHRMFQITEIYEEWTQLTRRYQKIAHLRIYTANELSKDQENRLKEAIGPRFPGRTISLTILIDKTLIGGIKVEYRGQSLDRSVARELEELYTTI
jgi:F-type H+-transporting ATPase subunit delta